MRGRARVNRPPAEHRPCRSGSRTGERPHPAPPGRAPRGAAAPRADRLPTGPGGESGDGPDGAAPVLHPFDTSGRPRSVRVRTGARGTRPSGARADVELFLLGTAHEGSERS